ncbi:putative DEAD-box ATP-dependent RNA helicase 33 [Abeliophyllum distichum]|uniref:ATP-dependent RNA helicase n=1 Tax=Abeliophyllum distichum TaxID=126358 RepID=A0ABD1TWG9_9LAMI
MGGGPRTFPGGLNKWQWKRMHEKKAREKEKRLLEQEKQVYQARIRSEIRAKLANAENPGSQKPHQNQPNYGPLSPQDHIKALADRFMKDGAEDLWNESDGPVKTSAPNRSKSQIFGEPINLQQLILKKSGLSGKNEDGVGELSGNLSGFSKGRSFSTHIVWGSNLMGICGNGKDGSVSKEGSSGGRRVRWPRFRGNKMDSSDDDDDDTDDYDDDEEEMESTGTCEKDCGEKDEEESILSSKRFDESDVSSLSVRALTEAGYLQMTRVQDATFSACLEGKDALVKARTGTGKSVAFLLPAIETVLKASSSKIVQRVPPVYVLIICPTRELASQIAAEANVLLKYHEGIGVQTLVGGTRFKVDQKHLESDPCQIIVATPGRLLDHIENKSGLSVRLMRLKMLILDEADHLLDLGFRKDMEKIVDCLPRQRQSLLFSATIPKEVRRISQLVLKREHAYINTVGVGCLETHAKIKQFYYVAPHEQHFQIVHHLIKSHISQVLGYKVIVFCTTAMMTSLMFSLLREMKLKVREIHSKKPQSYRTRISEEFKESKELILITSDVSARGVNYPDVTLVIQVGIPSDREQYIHRLGRTGRQGKEGEGILLLAPWEEYFMDDIKDLPIEKCPLPHFDPDAKVQMEDSMKKIDTSVKEAAYHAWLGYYNSINEIGRDKTSLVELANQFSQSICLEKPPALYRKTAIKMGLKGIPGIRIRK